MPNKIDSTLATYQQLKGPSERQRTGNDSAGPGSTRAPSTADTVDVTSSARELASLEAAIRDASVTDSDRVEAVRARIEDGSYQVDAKRVADNILGMDQALPLG